MPGELRAGWDAVTQGAFAGPASRAALQAAAWLTQQGAAFGVRTPSVAERARALGVETYMAALQLPEAAGYDAQGNAFDFRALALSVGPGVRTWLAGGALPSATWPDAAGLRRLFEEVRRNVPAGLGPLAAGPLTTNVAALLQEAHNEGSLDLAAGTGRGAVCRLPPAAP